MNKDNQIVDILKEILTEEYNIDIFSPVRDIKEAVDVAAYLLRKHTNLKNFAISKTLNRSTKAEYPSIAGKILEERMVYDVEFRRKVISIEIRLLNKLSEL